MEYQMERQLSEIEAREEEMKCQITISIAEGEIEKNKMVLSGWWNLWASECSKPSTKSKPKQFNTKELKHEAFFSLRNSLRLNRSTLKTSNTPGETTQNQRWLPKRATLGPRASSEHQQWCGGDQSGWQHHYSFPPPPPPAPGWKHRASTIIPIRTRLFANAFGSIPGSPLYSFVTR